MKGNLGFVALIALLLVGGGGVLVWSFSPSDENKGASKREVLRSRRIIQDGKVGMKKGNKPARRQAKKVTEDTAVHVKPDISLESEDEEKIKGEMKRLYAELQAALDADAGKGVFALVRKMKNMDEWPDEIPRSVKLKALEALKWCGGSSGSGSAGSARGISELASFAGDKDPVVQQETVSALTDMLSDASIGDRATAEIVKQLAGQLTDYDALDTLIMELNNMRNSVRVDTAKAIYASGNETAVKVMDENVEFLFMGEEVEVTGRKDLDAYAKANPDDPDDEDFYGPQKD